ncbi:MAG: peptidase S10 [Gammaproteobacteria bacterium]
MSKRYFPGRPSLALAALVVSSVALAAGPPSGKASPSTVKPKTVVTHGSVTVEGHRIPYTATTGTIILRNSKGKPTASMFYVAYTKDGVSSENNRPVTFFWNGGPGSSSVWLHMGAFGPDRVVTKDDTHTPPAPYKLVNNDYSLLDKTDEVFIDAVSTGYSKIITKADGGAGKSSDFWGVDGDTKSFAQFITRYLTKNHRWNSPKYLFGESYGTTRASALAAYLEMHDNIDPNGVILLSSILNFYTDSFNDGNDLPYELWLPTYTAVADYHHALPNPPKDLQAYLKQVEAFAIGPYAHALAEGNTLGSAEKQSIAEKLHEYTGLSTAYLMKANLRVTGMEFEHQLLNANDETVGRLDARFKGPSMDPLSQMAYYDPQGAAISSAYVSAFNDYAEKVLKFNENFPYVPESGKVNQSWNWKHQNPQTGQTWPGLPNVAVDLSQAMKYNPDLKVLVNAGYYDLATPFYAAKYQVDHLQIPKSIQDNVKLAYYYSGHMVYAHLPSLKKLHDTVAAFISKNK